MKKFLIIIVTGLLWFNVLFAKTITIEDRVILNVPENFQYLKSETPGEILESLVPFVGSNVKSYLVGTNKSIKFTKLYQESPDTIYEPIYVKLEKKNFTSEQAQMKFVVREIKKIFKKVGYEGVLWILFGDDKLEDIDDELYQFVTEIRNMNDNEIKKELKDINKDFVDGIRNSFGEMSRFIKISKFNIKKSQFNDPMISFFIKYNIQGFSGLTDQLLSELKKKDIVLIEDVCESHGAKHNNRKLGTFGLISNFSFYYAHHLSTIEGGMICTNDENVYQIARMLRSHGMIRQSTDQNIVSK